MGHPHLRGRELCSTSLELRVCVKHLKSSTRGYLFDRFSIAKEACGYLFHISMLAFRFYFNISMLLRMPGFDLWGQFHWPLESLRRSLITSGFVSGMFFWTLYTHGSSVVPAVVYNQFFLHCVLILSNSECCPKPNPGC